MYSNTGNLASFDSILETHCVLTFKEKQKVLFECAMGSNHSSKVRMDDVPCLRIRIPGGAGELRTELEDQAEDVLDDFHDWCRILGQ